MAKKKRSWNTYLSTAEGVGSLVSPLFSQEEVGFVLFGERPDSGLGKRS